MFQRAFIDEAYGGWNIYGARHDADDQDGFHAVIGGVIAETFVCYDSSFSPVTWSGTSVETALPLAVNVSITLLDSRTFAKWQALAGTAAQAALEQQAARTFSKMIFLGGRD